MYVCMWVWACECRCLPRPPLTYFLIFVVLRMKPKPDSRLFLFSVCLWYSCVLVCVHMCGDQRSLCWQSRLRTMRSQFFWLLLSVWIHLVTIVQLLLESSKSIPGKKLIRLTTQGPTVTDKLRLMAFMPVSFPSNRWTSPLNIGHEDLTVSIPGNTNCVYRDK